MAGAAGLAARPDFRIGSLTVKPGQCAVEGAAGSARLEPRVMQVLIALHEARGTTLTRDRLIETCWGRIVGDDALNRVIIKIRKIARDLADGSFELVTVPKVGYRLHQAGEGGAPKAVSIAVLPFESPGADDPWFAEGLAEEILSSLARQPGLRVAGRTSSWMLRDASPQEMASRLGVAYLVEGRVRQAEDRFRILVRVVETASALQVWSDEHECGREDVFAVQARIARTVAESVGRALAGAPEGPQSRSGEAYQLYLAGKSLLRLRSPGRLASAVDLLRRAVEFDPDFAPAWSRLGIALSMLAMMHSDPAALAAGRREAVARARHALSLAPDSAEVQADFGALLYQDDIYSALAHLESARMLGEDTSEFWFWLGFGRERLGDYPGAVAAHRRTVELDPLWYGAAFAGLALLDCGLAEEGMAWLGTIARHADSAAARLLLDARIALFHNQYAAAARLAREAAALSDPDLAIVALAVIAKAETGLGRIRAAREAAPFAIGETLVALVEGRIPPDILDAPFGGDRRLLRVNPQRYWAQRQLVSQGRAAEVVALYRRSLGSPEALEHHPDGYEAFLFDAAIIARALQACEEDAEAERLLGLAALAATRTLEAGMVPRSHYLAMAQIAAARGRAAEAAEWLQTVLERGLSPYCPVNWQQACDDPCFDNIRGEPRFAAIARAFAERHAAKQQAAAELPLRVPAR